MQASRDAIIAELIALDPSLAEHRDALERIVDELRDAYPSDPWRPAFQAELLARVRAQRGRRKESAPSYFFPIFSMMSRILYAGGGALVGAFLIFIALEQPWHTALPSQPTAMEDGDRAESAVMPVSPGAFGSLAQDAAGTANGLGGDESMSAKRMQGGGGGGGVDSMILPQDYVQPRYVYEGDIPLPAEDVSVYRRQRPQSKPSSAAFPAGFAENLIDWSALGSMDVQNVNLMGAGSDPFSVSIDYSDGSLSIYRNFTSGDRPEFRCTGDDPDCYENMRLREGDMLSDSEAIAIARNFLEELGIDASSYGEAKIQDDWRLWYEMTENKSDFYFPDQISVVFPLMLDGVAVYEEYGMPFGLTVGVDVRSKSASSLFNFQLQRYETSAYAPAKDAARVREVMEHGSLYYWDDPSARKADVTLGDPSQALVRILRWDAAKHSSDELLVPALVFPVTERSAEVNDTRQNVVIPLAAEMLEQAEGTVAIPFMMEKSAEESAGE